LLGAACIGFALVLLVVWIPLDVDGGVTERARGATRVGDALAPWVAGVLVALAGAMLLVGAWRGGDGGGGGVRDGDGDGVVNRGARGPVSALKFLLLLVTVFTVTIILYRYTGPAAVELARAVAGTGDALPDYRLLRDTAPWKYFGYFAGSWFMVFALIALTERRCTWRAALIAAAAPALIALCYDAPFDDLLLPPNGDV